MEAKCISSNRNMIIHVLEQELMTSSECSFLPDYTCRVGSAVLYRDGRLWVPPDMEGVLVTLSNLGLCDYLCETAPPKAGMIAYSAREHTGQSLTNLFCCLSARSLLLNQALESRRAFYVDPQLIRRLLAHPPVTVFDFLRALYGKAALYRGIEVNSEYIVFMSLPAFDSVKVWTSFTPDKVRSIAEALPMSLSATIRSLKK